MVVKPTQAVAVQGSGLGLAICREIVQAPWRDGSSGERRQDGVDILCIASLYYK
ncbi:hypothetical protein PV433_24995 [Paenibacillus sp. GYB004]|uniref:hypothetical protein n=1 Tax=Paenibacillus sp. GYB004 TaxID=2994393 RepID=UPI002F96C6A4